MQTDESVDSKTGLPLHRKLALDLVRMVRFYTVLPVARLSFEVDPFAIPDFRSSVWCMPFVGLIVALPGVAAMLLAGWFWLPAMLLAIIAIASTVIATGALHEDGMADFADCIGAQTVERRLEIMRDSRIGTFGAVALLLGVSAKLVCIAAIIDRHGLWAAAVALICAAMMSRVAALLPHHILPPARKDGKSIAVGRPRLPAIILAACIATAMTVILMRDFGLAKIAVSLALALIGSASMTFIAWKKLGGHTGDVIGAAQQMAEIAFFIGLNMSFYR